MKSIRALYKIGKGPSSSHTMGPEKAAKLFKSKFPAQRYKVILYGSLALTGKGHLTDKIIKDVLEDVEIVFSSDFVAEHPNTLDLIAYDEQDNQIGTMRVYSVGGGTIVIEGQTHQEETDVYPHQSFKEIMTYCKAENIRLPEYVKRFEGEDIRSFLKTIWHVMEASINEGLKKSGVLPGELEVERKAKSLYDKILHKEPSEIKESRLVSAYAFAVN